MICPYIINISVLLGGIISWGLMWPLIEDRQGDWYRADLGSGSLSGIQGYRVNSHSKRQFHEGFLFIEKINLL